MRSFSVLFFASLTAYASACLYPRDGGSSYSYDKATGPVVWHTLSPENKICATGKNQSPINVVPDANVNLAGALSFQTWPLISGQFDVINTGKTVQFTPKDSSKFKSTLNGRSYTLLQFHFHTPSEHRFKDKHFPLEVHFVHEDADKQLAVVGVFFDITPIIGGDFLFSLNDGLNAVAEPGATSVTSKLLFGSVKDTVATSKVYTYAGSLTTPPCKEGVTWFVAEKTLPISPAQYGRWKDIIKFNSRNTQNWPGQENLIVLAAAGL